MWLYVFWYFLGLQREQSKQKASCTITSEEEAGPSGSGLKRKSESKGGPCKKATKHNEWYIFCVCLPETLIFYLSISEVVTLFKNGVTRSHTEKCATCHPIG